MFRRRRGSHEIALKQNISSPDAFRRRAPTFSEGGEDREITLKRNVSSPDAFRRRAPTCSEGGDGAHQCRGVFGEDKQGAWISHRVKHIGSRGDLEAGGFLLHLAPREKEGVTFDGGTKGLATKRGGEERERD